ncbi:hypothetical protein X474_10570 [Dethiosulfatarculus sandiegensis]|uniref:Uncharacterized protein n=1 Tax=Dethiosulfatarculus sandiegensis TaxID=1429043 RepID=A0A0D2J796_9BACT|nr:hypothetical protein X474_10570 [Dethiosulfatarculus sandiegensis]
MQSVISFYLNLKLDFKPARDFKTWAGFFVPFRPFPKRPSRTDPFKKMFNFK